MKYTRKQCSGIHAVIRDIAVYTGHDTVTTREVLKQMFWGDRVGTFSLALDKCNPVDAQDFYNFLIDFALELGVEFATWAEP